MASASVQRINRSNRSAAAGASCVGRISTSAADGAITVGARILLTLVTTGILSELGLRFDLLISQRLGNPVQRAQTQVQRDAVKCGRHPTEPDLLNRSRGNSRCGYSIDVVP